MSELLTCAICVFCCLALFSAGATAAQSALPEAAPVNPHPDPGTSVLKWKDGKQAAFYLAFDDSCPTHLEHVIPELKKRKIVGTFYPIAGNPRFHASDEWKEAARSPYVVLANHTVTHGDFPDIEKFESEIVEANKILASLTPPEKRNRLVSFGKPGGVKYGIDDTQIRQALARHGLVYRERFHGAVLHVKTVEDVRGYIDATVEKGEMGHLDFHGVGGDWLVTPLEWFHAFLDKLEASREYLWISDHASIHIYATQRDTASLKVLEKAEGRIRLTLTTQADPALYQAPLTLATRVPAGWKRVRISQAEEQSTVQPVDGQVIYDATPGTAEIRLEPAE